MGIVLQLKRFSAVIEPIFLVLFFQIVFLPVLFFSENAQAEPTYTPGEVFAGLEYSNRIVGRVLASKNIKHFQVPLSREKAAKPMHVYELHVSVLHELYQYAIKNNRRPPPLVASTPIKYTPTDVYFLTRLVKNNIEQIYLDGGGVIDFSMKSYLKKSPVDVYQELFELYYNLNLLNGKTRVSPSEVYAQIYRAKEDLQSSLLILSKRLDDTQEEKKRLLVTAIYGMHPDGMLMPPLEQGKNPGDVLEKAFEVRDKLNVLRKRNKLSIIKRPESNDYKTVKPIDIFLQTQFIIAELNLLKLPLNILSSSTTITPVSGKTPSDVYHEMKHLGYMLDRLINTL